LYPDATKVRGDICWLIERRNGVFLSCFGHRREKEENRPVDGPIDGPVEERIFSETMT
jgi:hypothetical protein